MPPVLSIISGLSAMKKRNKTRIRTKNRTRSKGRSRTKRKVGKGICGVSVNSLLRRGKKISRLNRFNRFGRFGRVNRVGKFSRLGCSANGIGSSNIFHCPTSKSNVDPSTHRHYGKTEIERHKKINSIMNRFGVKKLKFKPTTKGRKIKRKARKSKNKHISSGVRGLFGFGNLLGVGKMKRKSLGRSLARRRKIARGKCRRVAKRTVCRTKRGKPFIRRDIARRKHNSAGRFALRGIGLGGFGAFRGDSCAHKVIRAGYGGFKVKRRTHKKGRSRGLGSFGIGALPIPSSVKSFLPPINKDSMLKSLSVIGGAVTPITIQNLAVPVKWRTGIMGMLTYTLIGGGLIAVSNKVGVLKSRSVEIGQGVVIGFVWQLLQNYVLKRSLIPVMNTRAATALKGVDACASCANAGDCVGDNGEPIGCLGYFDGVGDDEVGDDLDDDLVLSGDDDDLGDYLQVDEDDD